MSALRPGACAKCRQARTASAWWALFAVFGLGNAAAAHSHYWAVIALGTLALMCAWFSGLAILPEEHDHGR